VSTSATGSSRRQYEACVAPLARATVLFAASAAVAEAAFGAALLLRGPDDSTALTWTSRLQRPDRHTPSLTAHPWWPGHDAVSLLEDAYPTLLAEFEAAEARKGGAAAAASAYLRRRADAFVAKPKEGWGRMTANCSSAPATCSLVRRLQPARGYTHPWSLRRTSVLTTPGPSFEPHYYPWSRLRTAPSHGPPRVLTIPGPRTVVMV
jgi:hypothetical protein